MTKSRTRHFFAVRIIRQSTGMIETRIVNCFDESHAMQAALRFRKGFRIWSIARATAGEIEHRFNTLADQGLISQVEAQRIIDRAIALEH